MVGNFNGALEEVPRLLSFPPVQTHRTREHRTEIDHLESQIITMFFEFMPLVVDGQEIFAPNTFEFHIVEPQRLHLPESSERILDGGWVAVLRDCVEPAATDSHFGHPSSIVENPIHRSND